jgi:NADPH-dependent 2,4-dienoyl-CoA reductase/sulfur reductase-like enzyme
MTYPYVIIGGDAAGMSTASKIKRELPDTHVLVFERGPHISYSACGIPYWLGGVVESDRRLVVLTPERARQRRGIDVRIHHEVTAIDPAARTVTVIQRTSNDAFRQPYEKLLIATGASAVKPPIPGMDLPGVFTVRSLADAQHIHRFIEQRHPQHGVIIGGGYIGLEMAEALRDRSLDVILVELLPQIMPNFDTDMVKEVTTHLAEKGVAVRTGAQVRAVEQTETALTVEVEQQGERSRITTDLVIMATGVRPNSDLARAAGLRIGHTGAIWVDDRMCTSDPAIYAAGDCVEHYHLVLGENDWIPLATSANKGGRLAGDNMAGGDARFPGIVGTAIVKVFDYTMAITGLTEMEAKRSGKFGAQGEYVGAATISEHEKASYWPGVEEIKVKLVFDKRDGRLLGGQLVGKDGVNKRIDILATALHARMTVLDVGWLDLSYAPPYSSTWDPVQVCANVAAREII